MCLLQPVSSGLCALLRLATGNRRAGNFAVFMALTTVAALFPCFTSGAAIVAGLCDFDVLSCALGGSRSIAFV